MSGENRRIIDYERRPEPSKLSSALLPNVAVISACAIGAISDSLISLVPSGFARAVALFLLAVPQLLPPYLALICLKNAKKYRSPVQTRFLAVLALTMTGNFLVGFAAIVHHASKCGSAHQ